MKLLCFGFFQVSSLLHPALDELRDSAKARNDLTDAALKVIVGYLGTIEMPDAVSLAAIRNCIRRLRVERKVHTVVLMSLFDDRVLLINHHGLRLAEYPASQITYCGMCTDDSRYVFCNCREESWSACLLLCIHHVMTPAYLVVRMTCK